MSQNAGPFSSATAFEAAATFVSALEQFHSVASFYPLDHGKCREAAGPLYRALEAIPVEGTALSLEPAGADLRLEGQTLTAETEGVDFLVQLLDTLGIQRLELPRRPNLEDLHQAVQALNRLKLEADSAVSLRTLDPRGIPETITVVPREFGWGRFRLGGSLDLPSELGEKLDTLAERIDQLNWPDERKEELRRQTETFLARTVERLDQQQLNRNTPTAGSPSSLEDVLILGADAIRQALDKWPRSGDAPNLYHLFQEVGRSLALAATTDAVDLIMDVLHETAGVDFQQPDEPVSPGWKRDDTVYAHSVAELRERLPRSPDAEAVCVDLDPAPLKRDLETETLSLRMALMAVGVAGPGGEKLGRTLARELDRPFSTQTSERLFTALENLLREGDRRPVDSLLPYLLPPLARFAGEDLALFLSFEVGVEKVERLALIWPHLVGLLLAPRVPAHKELRRVSVQLISALPALAAAQEAHRLDYLEVVRRGKFGSAIFSLPPARTGNALRALLTGRQAVTAGRRIRAAWTHKPPSALAGLVATIGGEDDPAWREACRIVLAHPETLDLPLEEAAVISGFLRPAIAAVGDTNRGASWLPSALEQLGLLGDRQAIPILRRVVEERKLGLIPAWPGPCRQAAREALEALDALDAGEKGAVD